MVRQSTEKARLVKMLSEVPLFSRLDKKELQIIAAAGREVDFEPGKEILKQGEPGLAFLLILDGKVEVQRRGKTVTTLNPGNFFGEMSVLDDRPRSADVVAIEQTKCFGIASWSFFPVLRNNPDMALGIIKELVRRLRQVDEGPSE